MDEYNSGMDPEVKIYFRKIVTSFTLGLIWLMVMATAGLFFRLAIVKDAWRWYHFVFYAAFAASFFWLLRALYRVWKGSNSHPRPVSEGEEGGG